jgi:two-component system LytT family response regulator
MDCITVDDNSMARVAIRQLIEKVDFLTLKQECSGAVEAFNYLKREPTDLIFLDVEMPEMTGTELIRNIGNDPFIVLITGKDQYAVEAFDLRVADYLIKPVSISRFMVAMGKVKELFDAKNRPLQSMEKEKEYIFIRSNSILTKIILQEILYIQALGDYANIYTSTKRYTIHTTLSNFAKKLPSSKFYRIHRCYLVALDHIDHVEDNSAYICKHPIPIGIPQKKELLLRLNLI